MSVKLNRNKSQIITRDLGISNFSLDYIDAWICANKS